MLYSGVTGKISMKSGTGEPVDIMHMSSWSVEMSKDIIEAASFGDDYKEKIPGIKDWSASADGKADFATDSGQKTLYDAFNSGAALEGSFYLDTTTFLTGTVYIESLSVSHAADGAADVSISLAGSGANTLTLSS